MSQLDPNHRDAIRAIVLQEAATPTARPRMRVAIAVAVAAALVGGGGITYAVTAHNGAGGNTSAHPAATVSPRPGLSPTASPATPGEAGNGSTPIGPAAALVLHGASLDVTDSAGGIVTTIPLSAGATAVVSSLERVLGPAVRSTYDAGSCEGPGPSPTANPIAQYKWGGGLTVTDIADQSGRILVSFDGASVNGIALTTPDGATVGGPAGVASTIAGARTANDPATNSTYIWYDLTRSANGSGLVGVMVAADSPRGTISYITSPQYYFEVTGGTSDDGGC